MNVELRGQFAATLGILHAMLALLEKRSGLMLSTPCSYVEAMGGYLRLRLACFPYCNLPRPPHRIRRPLPTLPEPASATFALKAGLWLRRGRRDQAQNPLIPLSNSPEPPL